MGWSSKWEFRTNSGSNMMKYLRVAHLPRMGVRIPRLNFHVPLPRLPNGWYPQIIHFNRVFHPFWGTPIFWKHPYLWGPNDTSSHCVWKPRDYDWEKRKNSKKWAILFPKQSMYGTFTYIYHKNKPNVGQYTIPCMDDVGFKPRTTNPHLPPSCPLFTHPL